MTDFVVTCSQHATAGDALLIIFGCMAGLIFLGLFIWAMVWAATH